MPKHSPRLQGNILTEPSDLSEVANTLRRQALYVCFFRNGKKEEQKPFYPPSCYPTAFSFRGIKMGVNFNNIYILHLDAIVAFTQDVWLIWLGTGVEEVGVWWTHPDSSGSGQEEFCKEKKKRGSQLFSKPLNLEYK